MELVEVEVWVLVDEEGDSQVAGEQGELSPPEGIASRMVRVVVRVPKPVPSTVTVTVGPEQDGVSATE